MRVVDIAAETTASLSRDVVEKAEVGQEKVVQTIVGMEAIREATSELKASHQALGVEMMMAVAEWTPSLLLSLGSQASQGPMNMIVTNVPGPQFPLYMLGARLLEMYPMVPLLENTGLGIALFSYDGSLFWGFNADWDALPDLHDLVDAIELEFEDLRKAAVAGA